MRVCVCTCRDLLLWNASTGAPVRTLRAESAATAAVLWGARAVYGAGCDGRVSMWTSPSADTTTDSDTDAGDGESD